MKAYQPTEISRQIFIVVLLFCFAATTLAQRSGNAKRNPIAKYSFATVNVDMANVRERPDGSSPVVTVLERGEVVILLEAKHTNGWYSVLRGEERGWMHGNLLTPNQVNLGSALGEHHGTLFRTINERQSGGFRVYFLWRTLKTEESRRGIWTRFEPIANTDYQRHYRLPRDFAYSLSYVRVDCRDDRISMGRAIHYSGNGDVLRSSSVDIGTDSDPVVPGSLGEAIMLELCRSS